MDFVAVGQYTPSQPWFHAECHALRVIADRELGGCTDKIYPLLGGGYIHRANPSHGEMAGAIARDLRAVQEEGLSAAGFFAFHEFRTHSETVRRFSNMLSN